MTLRPRTALVAALLIVPGGVLAASPANAATGYSTTTQYIGGGNSVNIRNAPSNASSASIVRAVPVGTPLDIQCQTVGTKIGTGTYAANRTWDKLADGTFIHDVVTTTPVGTRVPLSDGGYVAWSPGIPQCSTPPAAAPPAVASGAVAQALQWADQQVQGGRWQADPVDASRYTDWGAIYGEWSGDCPKFVQSAYFHAGRTLLTGDAKVMWQKYGSPTNGAVRPPAGALVFWKSQSYWGHVALADGNGMVYTTQKGDGARLPIAHIDLTRLYGQPTGWALP